MLRQNTSPIRTYLVKKKASLFLLTALRFYRTLRRNAALASSQLPPGANGPREKFLKLPVGRARFLQSRNINRCGGAMARRRQMCKLSISLLLILTSSSFAATFYVGGCHGSGYATISAAIAAAPAGSIVAVCPGTYGEQIVINQALTLEGLLIGGGNGVVIAPPVGGLTNRVTRLNSSTLIWYQILVQNTAGLVNISGIAIDGTGNNLGIGGFIVGLYYRDTPGGKVNDVSFRNQSCHCDAGEGLLLEAESFTPTLTVTNNNFRGFGSAMELDQVIAGNSPVNISVQGNVIRGPGQGIVVQQAIGTIASNEIVDVLSGLGLFSTALTVKSNVFFTSADGIASFSGSNTISTNRIDAGGKDGIDLGNAGHDIIQSNTIVNSTTAIEGCGASVSGDSVSGNTIMDATNGLDLPSSVTLGTNHFYDVVTNALACTN